MPWSDRRTATTVLLAAGVVVLAVGAFYANAYFSTRDPVVVRVCACPLLTEWTASLPLSPEGHHLDPHQVEVNEGLNGYSFRGHSPEIVIDRQALIDASASAGINHEITADRPGFWQVWFFPGPTRGTSPWYVIVGVSDVGVGVNVSVGPVDAPQGVETMEELRDFYQQGGEAVVAAQEERQRQAIEILGPVRAALEMMVEDPSA